jgi:hypothetical protein
LVVEASILARLLRIKLLRLDATVLVVPAGATAPLISMGVPRERLPALPPADPPGLRRRGSLVEAVRFLDEGAELLARARRNRSVLQNLDAAR